MIDNNINKIKKILHKSLDKNNVNDTFLLLESYCNYLYRANVCFCDKDISRVVQLLAVQFESEYNEFGNQCGEKKFDVVFLLTSSNFST